MRTMKTVICLLIAASSIAFGGPLDDTIRYDLQYQGASLPDRTYVQGVSPRVVFDIYNNGRDVSTNMANSYMVWRASAGATNTAWLSVTNTGSYGTAGKYVIQLPILGTNATDWVYTGVLFTDDGGKHAIQFGNLSITESTGVTATNDFIAITDQTVSQTYVDAQDVIYSNGAVATASNYTDAAVAAIPSPATVSNWVESTFLPLAGGTMAGTIDINGQNITNTARLHFSGGSAEQGTLSWNTDEQTLDLNQGITTLQLGQEMVSQVTSDESFTLTNGVAVYRSGTTGASGREKVKLMIADGSIEPHLFLGIVTEDIDPGEDGKVTVFGKVRGIPTSMWSEGDDLYVSWTEAGQLTNSIPPVNGDQALFVGVVVVDHLNNGTIKVDIHPHNRNEAIGYALATSNWVESTYWTSNGIVAAGYLTAEADTLATVMTRGATASADLVMGGYNITNALSVSVEEGSTSGGETGLVSMSVFAGEDAAYGFLSATYDEDGIGPVTATMAASSQPGAAWDMGGALLLGVGDPTSAAFVGDRGYNDTRYTLASFHGIRQNASTVTNLTLTPTKYAIKWTPVDGPTTFAMSTATTYPRATYSLWVFATNSITFDANIELFNSITATGTNLWVIQPADTLTNWTAVGRAF